MRTIKAILKKIPGHDIDTCQECGARDFVTTPLPEDFNWLIANMTVVPGRSPPDWIARRMEPKLL